MSVVHVLVKIYKIWNVIINTVAIKFVILIKNMQISVTTSSFLWISIFSLDPNLFKSPYGVTCSFGVYLGTADRFSGGGVSKYKISWKSVQWEPSYSMRTDGQYEANRRFSQFCERRQNIISCSLPGIEKMFPCSSSHRNNCTFLTLVIFGWRCINDLILTVLRWDSWKKNRTQAVVWLTP